MSDVNLSEELQKILDNESNNSIMKWNSRKISEHKNNALQQLNQPRNKLKEFNKKLKEYRYVDELNDLKYGSYIKWINLINPDNIKLTTGGTLVEVILNDNGIVLIVKLFNNRRLTLNFDKCLIFQKITFQEKILLKAIDYLEFN